MNWMFLYFLSQPWFVVLWYAFGVLGLLFVIYDMRTSNKTLKPAMKWAWPILVLFFSFIGLSLYFATARHPRGRKGAMADELGPLFEPSAIVARRRGSRATVLAVAGEGLGVMTAMVIARAAGMSVWQEFWFEYAVGFAFGWLIFGRKAVAGVVSRLLGQLVVSFRATFLSMLTLMAGIGLVTTYLTPMVGTLQPSPLTYGFWGYGMLGLLLGFALTYPMSWLLLKLGWLPGLDEPTAAGKPAISTTWPAKLRFLVPALAWGCAVLLVTARLSDLREQSPSRSEPAARIPETDGNPGRALVAGTKISLVRAISALRIADWSEASLAMDDAWRAAQTGVYSAPGTFYDALEQIEQARLAYQEGRSHKAEQCLDTAYLVLGDSGEGRPAPADLHRYMDAKVINPEGAIIGDVAGVSPSSVEIVLGGWRHAFGFIDFTSGRHVNVPIRALQLGPPDSVGTRFVAIPTARIPGYKRPAGQGIVAG